MHRIYSKALRVVAFLGEAWEGNDIVMEYLAMLGSDKDLHYSLSQKHFASYQGFDASSDLLCTYVAKFFALPWFQRTWTIQEYFLAQDVIFQCGKPKHPETLFRDVLDNIHHHTEHCCDENVPLTYFDGAEKIPLQGLYAHRALWESNSSPSSFNFIKLLILSRARKTYDLRDKVYGILSLAVQSFRKTFAANYALSVSEVYRKMIINSIAIHQSLDVLSCIIGNAVNEFELSSFVPNWNLEIRSIVTHNFVPYLVGNNFQWKLQCISRDSAPNDLCWKWPSNCSDYCGRRNYEHPGRQTQSGHPLPVLCI